ncbi:MAG TPA: class I SAM-dependent methyltransferase [Roseiarcus sp.]|nr:class I SAM-dependent methyltransferase [Roseiarcus sp.]
MTEPALRGPAMWDERYGGEHYAYGLEPNRFLEAQAHRLKPGMKAVVPGDGEGRNGVFLASLGLDVDTLDLSEQGVAKARRFAVERGVSLNALRVDALAWEWPEEIYDLVALIFLHLIEPHRKAVHAKAIRALKPGGLLVLEAFRPEQIERHAAGTRGGPRDAALLYSLDAIRRDFEEEEILMLDAAEAEMSEGPLQAGMSAVVRALIRRR